MAFWREFVSGVVLCVLCCAALIYSFSPPARRAARQTNVLLDSRTMDRLEGVDASPAAEAEASADGAPAPKDASGDTLTTPGQAAVEDLSERVLFEDSPGTLPASADVRWLHEPSDVTDRLLPVEAEPAPPLGRQAEPEVDVGEPLPTIVLAPEDGAPVPNDGDVPEQDCAPAPRLPDSEFMAASPSAPAPRPADLLPDEPGAEPPSEPYPRELDHFASPSPESPESPPAHTANRPTWHSPTALIERIEHLAEQAESRAWAVAVRRQMEALGAAMEAQVADAGALVDALDALDAAAEEAVALADHAADPALVTQWQRAAHALRRRIDVWRFADQLGRAFEHGAADAPCEWNTLALALDRFEAHVGDTTVGQAWREYLLLDALRQRAAQRGAQDESAGRELAEVTLQRLTQMPMDPRQRRFVTSGPVDELRARLHRLAAAPVDFGRLLANLERYERTGLSGNARPVARHYHRLTLADSDAQRALADRLAMHYRNANVRFAVSEDLLNRLMPQRDPEVAPVNDIVLGTPVYGRRATSTDVQVSLIPNPHRARLALDVRGRILSRTSSNSGPATFLTNSLGSYVARKPLELDLDGIRTGGADVSVANDLRLLEVRTELDGLPLVGSLVNSVARSQHAQNRPAANAEIRAKIYQQAKSRVDREADERLTEVSERLQTKLLEPMRRLRLDPALIDAETTDDRLNMRIRLAGEGQLGSHTPRPRAPSDSLASFQLHESAINNVIDRLDLNGRTFPLTELSRHVAAMLNREEGWLHISPEHEDVAITFAASDAVSVRCRQGQVGITLSIDRLRHERRVWRDFQVHASYRAETQGIGVELVREGVVQLSGDRLPLGSQIALRGIFVRIFAHRRPWDLLPREMAENPNLADLAVTQLTIDDGWIGLALGPRHIAGRPRRLMR